MYNNITFFRFIHSGHVKRVLNANKGPFHLRFDKILADQRERVNNSLEKLKIEKDTLARELLAQKNEFFNIFQLNQGKKLLDSTQKTSKPVVNSVNEARRIYRILKPDSSSFFEEQSMIHMKSKMDSLISGDKLDNNIVDNDIVFTSTSFTLSVISLLESLTNDIYSFCQYLNVEELPEKNYENLTLIFDALEKHVKLKLDGSNVDEWVDKIWPKLNLLLIDELRDITLEEMKDWLKNHLKFVYNNLKLVNEDFGEWYDFTKHLIYDSIPLPNQVEAKIGFPAEKSTHYLSLLLSLFQNVKVDGLEDLVKILESLGLKKWFEMLPNEIETSLFGVQRSFDKFEWNKEDFDSSCLLIETMTRNLDYLLNIETFSPNSILSNSSKNLRANLDEAEENRWLTSLEIKEMVNKVCSLKFNPDDEITPLKQMLIDEHEFSKRVGSVEFGDGDWKWVVPSVDSIFDKNRNIYIRNKSNLDPLIRLDNLKSFILSRKRMRSMTKEGRVYFIRVIVAIGDGNGYFGMGIGYGNDVNSAKNSGIENALKNMFFLDYDPFESLTTPVLGREYGSRCLIQPRRFGSGIRCNRKFLPLLYLIGLNNVRFKLKGTNSWVTRIRSIRKALESILSRRSICNMLGKRYVSVGAPGDHTIHWSDAWFNPLLKEHIARLNKLKRMRFNFSRRNRMKYNLLLPTDLKDPIPYYNKNKIKSIIIQ